MVQSGSGEPIPVGVTLGNSTTVNLAAGTTTLGTIQVVGSRVVNAVDVTSTESATNITAQEIERMPVERNVSSVALLAPGVAGGSAGFRSEEHTSELQSLMRISYAVFCLKKQTTTKTDNAST